MYIKGNLLPEMQKVISSLAVLVIDETTDVERTKKPFDPNRSNFSPIIDITASQQHVIMLAQAYNCPIFLFQFDPEFPTGSYIYVHNDDDPLSNYTDCTKKSIRALLPQNTRVINKHGYNAFTKSNLSQLLAQQHQCNGVKNLIVMGWNSNACIAATIGPEVRNGKNYQLGLGAVDHNFTVLTCQQILTGEDAWWTEHSPLIQFYSHL